jgi:hypothetical protein
MKAKYWPCFEVYGPFIAFRFIAWQTAAWLAADHPQISFQVAVYITLQNGIIVYDFGRGWRIRPKRLSRCENEEGLSGFATPGNNRVW